MQMPSTVLTNSAVTQVNYLQLYFTIILNTSSIILKHVIYLNSLMKGPRSKR